MKHIIDTKNWKRKEHYAFFKDYEEPFFGITARVNCTEAYRYTKRNRLSFFLYYMYKSLLAVNATEEFRYRIEGEDIVCYDRVHGSTTTLNADNVFAFAFLPFTGDFNEYYTEAKKEIGMIRSISGMNLNENSRRTDVIHYSTVPWVSFTGLSFERNFARPDSIPKITFGKFFTEKERLWLPLSVSAHHGLMDGIHIGTYFELFQEALNTNE